MTVQTFRPEDHHLAAAVQASAPPLADRLRTGPGTHGRPPITRSVTGMASTDGGLSSGVWESGAGTQDFAHSTDEWVYILEGEAHVTIGDDTHVLRAGEAVYFPAGVEMTWTIPRYVRKLWVHRRAPFRVRLANKLRRLAAEVPRRLGRHAGAAGAVATGWAMVDGLGPLA